MGLKIISQKYRDNILRLNLKTPKDIIQGLSNLVGADIFATYLADRGLDPIIHNYSVRDPGDVVSASVAPRLLAMKRNMPIPNNENEVGKPAYINDYTVQYSDSIDATANKVLPKLFKKNRPFNNADPSENDALFQSEFGYAYTTLLNTVGKLTVINDLNVPDMFKLSTLRTQSAEMSLDLALQENRYTPDALEVYDANQTLLLPPTLSYTPNYKIPDPQTYDAETFLNLPIGSPASSILFNTSTDPLSLLLGGNVAQPLKDESLMMNINALQLKFNFNARIQQNIAKETILRTGIDEAMTNPYAAANLITNPQGWFEKNYTISVSSNPIGKALDFTNRLMGLTLPFADINYNSEDYIPSCFGNTTPYDNKAKTGVGKLLADLTGKTARNDRDVYFLNHTGDGQKASLFANINMNKYSPNYLADYQSGIFQAGEEFAQFVRGMTGFIGVGAGKRPVGDFYIGSKSKNQDPFYLLQDADGDMVNTTEHMIDVLKNTTTDKPYDEPGYDEVSEYGSILTNFIWKGGGVNTVETYDPVTKSRLSIPLTVNIQSDKLSDSKNFIECSILDKTKRLVNKGVNGFPSPIDQTLVKFYDGYVFNSRANATISPIRTNVTNQKGEIIGYRYNVPGLDANGKRNAEKMFNGAELCRVWTKNRPYATVTNAIRYSELIRSEQNSVLDRYGNLSIYPSELNVNTGYGAGVSNAKIYTDKRARKYMFSLENLAWRDSALFKDLPNCEKGPNDGRIMWFPPYDIQFTDDTSANWTTHQFLGRPEPIYTYNNSERSGTLRFKVVVDHPSILNLLVQKELAKLNDGEVDEILAAFWAGCIDYDIFELARIYNQFSQSDLDYFKQIVGSLDLRAKNKVLITKLAQANTTNPLSIAKADATNMSLPQSDVKALGLFFENDVPLNTSYNSNRVAPYDTGKVESFNTYFQQYKGLAITTDPAIVSKNAQSAKTVGIDPTWMKYNQTIGGISIGTIQTDKYITGDYKTAHWYGFDEQRNTIATELGGLKFQGYALDIDVTAYASPLNPTANPDKYNSDLAMRRYQSVIKWLVLEVLTQSSKNVYDTDKNQITTKTIEDFVSKLAKGKTTVYRGNTVDDVDTINFNLVEATEITTTKAITDITGYKTFNNNNYFIIQAPTATDSSVKVDCCCFETKTVANQIKANVSALTAVESTITSATQIGSIDSTEPNTGFANVACGVLSIQSSYARRVELTVTPKIGIKNPNKPTSVQQPASIVTANDDALNSNNITKRTIAQRILNKLITECDYFKVLEKDSPTVYSSLKQKLKYFQPAFHAMTPEGLNSRLTFLNQCMRPGETIKKSDGSGCDAKNTAFGRPPVCVLRIGDFYNTKIVINNLSIGYDPLVWDLNPEGIGVQPMIANVQMSFKYIGGSGLRTYVDQLQNALSFNYYANADIYDDRTFANNNADEEALVNAETDFFNQNQLDLIPIVANAEKYNQSEFNLNVAFGSLGHFVIARTPSAPGGVFNDQINTAVAYDPSKVYQGLTVISNNGKFYLRLPDNAKTYSISGNTLTGAAGAAPGSKYWTGITWQNYGEEGIYYDFKGNSVGNSNNTNQYQDKLYYNSYEVQYMDIFTELYNTYGTLVQNNVAYNKPINDNTILLQLILNKNYNKVMLSKPTPAPASDDVYYSSFNTLPLQYSGFTSTVTGLTSGINLFKAFDIEAVNRNYVELGNYDFNGKNYKFSPMILHLYPQEYLYRIGDGKSLVSSTNYNDSIRLNPGALSGGFMNNTQVNKETAGVYVKNYEYYKTNLDSLMDTLKTEMDAKIRLELSHFWFYNGNSLDVYKRYLQNFDLGHRQAFTDKLANKFNDYYTSLSTDIDTKLTALTDATDKFALLMGGVSIIADGYDLRKQADGTINVFELMPNGKKLSSTSTQIFGYEPYKQYKTMSFDNYQTIDFVEVRNRTTLATATSVSTANKLKFLSLGNGNYFFKQISKYTPIKSLAPGFVSNFLIDSVSLDNGTTITAPAANFAFGLVGAATGVTLNNSKNQNGLIGTTTTQNISNNTYANYYGMTYTFEKLNYELFDFSNKILDVMLNDNFMENHFDLDILISGDKDFLYAINAGSSSAPDSLFYYSSKSKLKTVPVRYYTYGTAHLKSSSAISMVTSVNNFIQYKLPLTDVLFNAASVTWQGTMPADLDAMNGTDVLMSGLVDLVFLDFFTTLTDNDKTDILNVIKTITPIGMDNTTRSGRNQIDRRYTTISGILDDIFTGINTYKTGAASAISNLTVAYNDNHDKVTLAFNNILTGNASLNPITPATVSAGLIKGSTGDYTVVIRDTNGVKESVKNNYKLFTAYQQLFNIKSTNETAQTVSPQTTTN